MLIRPFFILVLNRVILSFFEAISERFMVVFDRLSPF